MMTRDEQRSVRLMREVDAERKARITADQPRADRRIAAFRMQEIGAIRRHRGRHSGEHRLCLAAGMLAGDQSRRRRHLSQHDSDELRDLLAVRQAFQQRWILAHQRRSDAVDQADRELLGEGVPRAVRSEEHRQRGTHGSERCRGDIEQHDLADRSDRRVLGDFDGHRFDQAPQRRGHLVLAAAGALSLCFGVGFRRRSAGMLTTPRCRCSRQVSASPEPVGVDSMRGGYERWKALRLQCASGGTTPVIPTVCTSIIIPTEATM